jgi:hypothetical protein
MGEDQRGGQSQSWQARKNRERRRKGKSRKFREARSRDEFIEHLGAGCWEWKKQAAETAERERGYMRQQAKGVQVLDVDHHSNHRGCARR